MCRPTAATRTMHSSACSAQPPEATNACPAASGTRPTSALLPPTTYVTWMCTYIMPDLTLPLPVHFPGPVQPGFS